MKLIILGATGPTGVQLVEECLEQGHEVTALVRSPDKLQIKHDRLNVTQIDIFNENDLVTHLKGCEAVLSCLGAHPPVLCTSTLYTDSIKVITAAMRKTFVTRFVGISSWGTKYDEGLPWPIKWLYRPLYMRTVLPDMAAMEDYLTEQCQDLDFTIVRPTGLDNKPAGGVVVAEGQYVPNGELCIPRRDVANFMLQCVVKGQWKKGHVAIATGYKKR